MEKSRTSDRDTGEEPSSAASPASQKKRLEVLKLFRVLLRSIKRHYQWVEKETGMSGAQLWAMAEIAGAPGIRIGNVFLMAGVPSITAGMLDALTGTLEGGLPVLSQTIGSWAIESEVADLLRETEREHEGCAIGSYPFFREGRVGANFVVRSTDEAVLEAVCQALTIGLNALGREAVPGGI